MRSPLAVVSLLSVSLAAADQVTIRNGDRITGSIVKKDEKTLTIRSEVFGLITMPWNQVQTLTADRA